jgi:ComF family protein
MATLSLANLGKAALDLLYPPRCALCGRLGVLLCDGCATLLPRAAGRRCEVCWLPLAAGAACRACAEHEYAFAGLRSAYRYEGDVRRLVHAFKFGGQSALAPLLARPLIEVWGEQRLGADVSVPVPLTGRRRRGRGFNQSALLAREIGRAAGLPVSEALARRRFPVPQARSRTAAERWRNVQGAFAVTDAEAFAGRRVLLVDDLATTGATLDACARELLAAGAAEVIALTLARED